MTTIKDYLIEKLPVEEIPAIVQLSKDIQDSLSVQDKTDLLAIDAEMVRKKMKEKSGMITPDEAREEHIIKDAPAMLPVLQQIGERTANVQFLRDIEKYKEAPAIAIMKNFSVPGLLRRMRELRDMEIR